MDRSDPLAVQPIRPIPIPSLGPRNLSFEPHYAKRALARGEDPEEVIRQIAHYRSADKYDPLDYARRTVTKAQAELGANTQSDSRSETASKDDTREQGA